MAIKKMDRPPGSDMTVTQETGIKLVQEPFLDEEPGSPENAEDLLSDEEEPDAGEGDDEEEHDDYLEDDEDDDDEVEVGGQLQVPGTERKEIPELSKLGAQRAKQYALWKKHQAKTKDLDEQLLELMLEHVDELPKNADGDRFYRFEDRKGVTRDVILKRTERESISVVKTKGSDE